MDHPCIFFAKYILFKGNSQTVLRKIANFAGHQIDKTHEYISNISYSSSVTHSASEKVGYEKNWSCISFCTSYLVELGFLNC